jgi:integrase
MKEGTREMDGELKGFGVRSYASGQKSFFLRYRHKGRERLYTFGDYPTWKVAAARKEAIELRQRVDRGEDLLEQRDRNREAPTMRELYERYDRDYLPKLADRSAADRRSMFNKIILPRLGAKKVADITFNDCEKLHRDISKDRPVRANRVHEVMRRCFNLAMRWGWIERNPAEGIERNPELKREPSITIDQAAKLVEILDAHPERASADAIKLIMFTGCRRGEALSARWDQFNEALTIWTKPAATTKQRTLHRTPVSAAVTELLKARREATDGDFVFPGKDGNPLTDIKRTWNTVRKNCELEGLRLHDLRHNFASIAVSQGLSLPLIGAMLGHTQVQTTKRYAHLYDDPLLAAAELVSSQNYKNVIDIGRHK